LPEKDDMSCPSRAEGVDWDEAFAGLLADLEQAHDAHGQHAGESLQCVWSGYLATGCSCSARIPYDVVTRAWSRALNRGHAEGFFRVAWQEQVWLAYGLYDGHVRGVYCPAHSAERDRRAHGARTDALSPQSPA
jgi:hypothetical protein